MSTNNGTGAVMEGYVKTRHKVSQLGWVDRYVVLKPGEFQVYKDASKESQLTVIPLDEHTHVNVQAKRGHIRSQKELFRWHIEQKDGTSSDWAIYSEDDRKIWMQNMAKCGANGAKSQAETDGPDVMVSHWKCSCDVFEDHGTFSFLKCGRCGFLKQDHFFPEDIKAPDLVDEHEGWLSVLKSNMNKLSMNTYKRRFARLRGLVFEWAHDPNQADPDKRYTVNLDWTVVENESSYKRNDWLIDRDPVNFQFSVRMDQGSTVVFACESEADRDKWLKALLKAQQYCYELHQLRINHLNSKLQGDAAELPEAERAGLKEELDCVLSIGGKLPPAISKESEATASKLAKLAARLNAETLQGLNSFVEKGHTTKLIGTVQRLGAQSSLTTDDTQVLLEISACFRALYQSPVAVAQSLEDPQAIQALAVVAYSPQTRFSVLTHRVSQILLGLSVTSSDAAHVVLRALKSVHGKSLTATTMEKPAGPFGLVVGCLLAHLVEPFALSSLLNLLVQSVHKIVNIQDRLMYRTELRVSGLDHAMTVLKGRAVEWLASNPTADRGSAAASSTSSERRDSRATRLASITVAGTSEEGSSWKVTHDAFKSILTDIETYAANNVEDQHMEERSFDPHGIHGYLRRIERKVVEAGAPSLAGSANTATHDDVLRIARQLCNMLDNDTFSVKEFSDSLGRAHGRRTVNTLTRPQSMRGMQSVHSPAIIEDEEEDELDVRVVRGESVISPQDLAPAAAGGSSRGELMKALGRCVVEEVLPSQSDKKLNKQQRRQQQRRLDWLSLKQEGFEIINLPAAAASTPPPLPAAELTPAPPTGPFTEPPAPPPKEAASGPALKDDPKYAKYFKMLKMHIPPMAVAMKMKAEGLDDSILELDPEKPLPSEHGGKPASSSGGASGPALKDDPKYAKYFKMLKMHIPPMAVAMKMKAEGLDDSILQLDPEKPLPPEHGGKPASSGGGVMSSIASMLTGGKKGKAVKKAPTEQAKAPQPVILENPVRVKPGTQLKALFWDMIPVDSTEGTVWKEGLHYWQGKVMLGSQKLNEDIKRHAGAIEKCFAKAAPSKKLEDSLQKEIRSETKQDEVKFLDSRRHQNVSIAIVKLKMSAEKLKSNILSADESLGPDELELVNVILPDEEEEEAIRSYLDSTQGDTSKLRSSEKFIATLLSIDRLSRKIKLCHVLATAGESLEEMMGGIDMMQNSLAELKSSRSLRKLLKLTLYVGNFLNYGTQRVSYAIRVKTLEKLSLLKSNQPTEAKTLLHFILQMAEDNEKDVLLLTEELQSLYDASRIDWSALKTSLTELQKNTNAAIIEAKMPDCQEHQPSDLIDFLNDLSNSVQDVNDAVSETEIQMKQVLKLYGEEQMNIQEWFEFMASFLRTFERAARDNEDLTCQAARSDRFNYSYLKGNGSEEEKAAEPQGKDVGGVQTTKVSGIFVRSKPAADKALPTQAAAKPSAHSSAAGGKKPVASGSSTAMSIQAIKEAAMRAAREKSATGGSKQPAAAPASTSSQTGDRTVKIHSSSGSTSASNRKAAPSKDEWELDF